MSSNLKKRLVTLLILWACAWQVAAQRPIIDIYPEASSVNEPFGEAFFLITKTGPGEVVVRFELDGTASPGTDYSLSPGNRQITIPATTNRAFVKLRALEDLIVEPEESVVLKLVPDPSYIIGDASLAAIRIRDNDPDGLPTVTLKAPLVAALQTGVTLRGEAQGAVTSAWLYENDVLIRTPIVRRFESVALFDSSWTPDSAGLHHLTAVVADNRGLMATSTVPVLVAESIHPPVAMGHSPDGLNVISGAVTTSIVQNGRGYGFVEFPIPAVKDFDAILKFRGAGNVSHELYAYAGDNVLNANDLTVAGELICGFNEAPRSASEFEIDVTAWAKRFSEKTIGFRLKLVPSSLSGPQANAGQTFTSFELLMFSRTNDVPPRARWLNAPANLVAIAEEPLVMQLQIVDPDSRVTKLQLTGDGPLLTDVVDLPPGTNLVSITWTNPSPQDVELALVLESDNGAKAISRFVPIHVAEARRGDPVHRWATKADWGDAFFIVDSNGLAWAWGSNEFRQLGLNILAQLVSQPMLLPPPAGRKWRQFAVGQIGSAALTDDGALYIMGQDSITPVPFQIPFPEGVYFWRQVEAAGAVFWLLDQSGRVWLRLDGRFEIKSTSRVRRIESSHEAISILAEREDGTLVTLPGDRDPVLRPSGVTHWTDFSSSSYSHTVGIGSDRQLYAWSDLHDRSWAIPVDPVFSTPTRVVIPRIAGWKRVVCNSAVTLAIDLNDRLLTWGYPNDIGSTNNFADRPALVTIPYAEAGWLDIGVANSFAVAISVDGNVYTWGRIPSEGGWQIAPLPQRLEIPGFLGNKLRILEMSPQNLGLEVIGVPGATISVEISTNLLDWTTVTNIANPTGKAVFSQEISASGNLFIRAR